MGVKIDERFAAQCSVVFNNNYDTCGTVTRASIDHLTPSDLESLFAPGGLFADLDAWFFTAIEMKACGTRTYGLYDWIMSGADRTKGRAALNIQKGMSGPSLLHPFILGKQDSVINTDFWAISQGWANSAYTAESTGPLDADDKAEGAAGDRIIRVVSRYGVDLDEKWFKTEQRLTIFSRSSTGVTRISQYKVLASATAADASYVDVLMEAENAGSAHPSDSAPTAGVVLIGVNNVNDYESWCHNSPNYDGKKRVPFWFQTMRRTRCVDEQYREFYQRLTTGNVNRAFKEFGDLDLAQRNAQDELNWKKQFCHAFFFNKPISANQTLALWESLEDIPTAGPFSVSTGMTGVNIGKRANFIGVHEQLYRCDRVRDLQNNPLNLYEWLDEVYRISRARETNGVNDTEQDWYTDEVFAANFHTAYVEYLKKEYGSSNISFEVILNQCKAGSNDLGFCWKTYNFKFPSNVRVNIITHKFFNDLRDAAKAESIESVGSLFVCLDMGKGGSIYWSQIATNRKVHKVGDLADLAKIDATAACTMATLTKEVTLISETGTAVVECPANSLWIQGVADAVPITTGKTGSSTSEYRNLY